MVKVGSIKKSVALKSVSTPFRMIGLGPLIIIITLFALLITGANHLSKKYSIENYTDPNPNAKLRATLFTDGNTANHAYVNGDWMSFINSNRNYTNVIFESKNRSEMKNFFKDEPEIKSLDLMNPQWNPFFPLVTFTIFETSGNIVKVVGGVNQQSGLNLALTTREFNRAINENYNKLYLK